MILVTGAAGQLGRLVVASLLEELPASEVVAGVRRLDRCDDLRDLGVQVRQADYERPEQWPAALDGIEKVLLIATSDVTKRLAHHSTVIEAVKAVPSATLLAYTSLLHVETSTYMHADSEREIEALIRRSGVPFVFLRHSWYTENYTEMVPSAVTDGKLYGAAKAGRVSAASRADYAAAAARVLTSQTAVDHSYELAGDTAFSLEEVAAEISRQSGKSVQYVDLSPAEFDAHLTSIGYPPPIATTLADADRVVAASELVDDTHQLSALIGRPTTPLADAVAAALKGTL